MIVQENSPDSTVSQSTSRPFPGFERFYSMNGGCGVHFHTEMEGTREEVHEHLRGTRVPTVPVRCEWFMGRRKPADFIFTSWANPMVVSDRVVALLRDSRLTGWSTYPVEVIGKDKTVISGYQGLAIVGRCASPNPELSRPRENVYPGGVFTDWYGFYFDESSWDGSDLFMPTTTFHVLATEAVMRLFKKNKVTNVEFTRLDEYKWPMDPRTMNLRG